MDILKIIAATTIESALDRIPGRDDNVVTSENFIVTILNYVYAAAGLVAVGFIVYGAINYLLSQGDPSKIKQSSQTLVWAVIGLVVVLLAVAITNWVVGTAGNLS